MKITTAIAILALFASAVFFVACGGGSTSNSTPSGSGTSTLNFQVTDSCYDGNTIYYKFFDKTDNLVWPSSSTYYYATQGNTYTSNLQCNTGAQICFGASENTGTDYPYWGVGSDGTQGCSDCCVTCSSNPATATLTCSGGMSSSSGAAEDNLKQSSSRSRDLQLDSLQPER